MSNKVDISEVTDFSDDLQEASTAIRSQLDMVKESIEAINGMSSFSGKAAKEAKQYFGELHLTILESFRGLFDDLEENLQQHIDTFGSDVDASESAMIQSNYLKDVKEDINEGFEDLKQQDEIISETIQKISDISSAVVPSFTDVSNGKKESVKLIKEQDGDLSAFNGKGDESNTKDLLHQIEEAMNHAKTSEGKARFADFEGASQNSELAKLKDYNSDKKDEQMEKAKDARDSALQEQNKPSSKQVVEKAYQEYKNGDIKYDQYTAILASVKNTSGNMNEEQLKEESTESFIEYLDDRNMLEQYVEDHRTFAKYVVDNMPKKAMEFGSGNIPLFFKKIGYNLDDFAKYLTSDDPKLVEQAEKLLEKSGSFSKYAKGAGKAVPGFGFGYGWIDDYYISGKSGGEATAHNGASLIAGGSVTVAGAILLSNPVGWAAVGVVAAGVGVTAIFELAYENNFKGLQDGLDWVGERLDSVGDAIVGGLDVINPFS